MTKSESKVSINIYGCCVSRDSVAFRQSKYVVPRYVQAISPLTVTSGKPLNLKTEDFSSYENVHNFTKRCICLDANKNAIDYLVETNADWLLFDVAELRRVVYFWRNAGIMLTKNSKLTRMLSVVELYTNGEIPSEIIPWELSEKELSVAVEMLCDEIFKYFSPQNIILNEFYNVDVYLNADGELCSFSEDEKVLGTVLCGRGKTVIAKANILRKNGLKRQKSALPPPQTKLLKLKKRMSFLNCRRAS